MGTFTFTKVIFKHHTFTFTQVWLLIHHFSQHWICFYDNITLYGVILHLLLLLILLVSFILEFDIFLSRWALLYCRHVSNNKKYSHELQLLFWKSGKGTVFEKSILLASDQRLSSQVPPFPGVSANDLSVSNLRKTVYCL